MHILIEESYSGNSRFYKILDGINSVAKKKHTEIKIYKSCADIPSDCRVAILICQSLKWSCDRIEELNVRGIHPLVFGFQYLDTMYKYSSIAPNYTKSAYRLTKFVLSNSEHRKKTAILGYNQDSLPDRLKYIGIRYAVNEMNGEYEVFKNNGDVLSCIDEFRKRCDGFSHIVCCNDNIAVMLYNKYPELLSDRTVCSCSGLKISEYFENPYPVCRINYHEAGIQLAMLYRFLIKEETIYSTVMTVDMDFLDGSCDVPMDFPGSAEIYSPSEIDFYGDENLRDMEMLDRMLDECDEIDIGILACICAQETYEVIADKYYMAINSVKYRVKKMLEISGAASRKELIALIGKYGVKFENKNKNE